jgi:hypothetical protein
LEPLKAIFEGFTYAELILTRVAAFVIYLVGLWKLMRYVRRL